MPPPMQATASQDLALTTEQNPARRRRLAGLAVAAPCIVVVAVAAWLEPDGRGYGTHTALGLPPCGMMQTQGMPCPTCGMTTAFANMAHGRFAAALRAQAFGAVLFVWVVLAALAGGLQAATARPVLRPVTRRLWWLWLLPIGALAGWGLKIAQGLADGSLPAR